MGAILFDFLVDFAVQQPEGLLPDFCDQNRTYSKTPRPLPSGPRLPEIPGTVDPALRKFLQGVRDAIQPTIGPVGGTIPQVVPNFRVERRPTGNLLLWDRGPFDTFYIIYRGTSNDFRFAASTAEIKIGASNLGEWFDSCGRDVIDGPIFYWIQPFNDSGAGPTSVIRADGCDPCCDDNLITPELQITAVCPVGFLAPGEEFEDTVTVSGGTPPYTFALEGLEGGTISAHGVINWTAPEEAGEFEYTVTVTDSAEGVVTLTCTLTIDVAACEVDVYPVTALLGCRTASGGGGKWEIGGWIDNADFTYEDYNASNIYRERHWFLLWTDVSNGLPEAGQDIYNAVDGDPDTWAEGRYTAHSGVFEYRKLILTDIPEPDPDRTLIDVTFSVDWEVDNHGGDGDMTFIIDVWDEPGSEVYTLNDTLPANVGVIGGDDSGASVARHVDTLTIPAAGYSAADTYIRCFGTGSSSHDFTEAQCLKIYGVKVTYRYCEDESSS